jgi:hypothetical protein
MRRQEEDYLAQARQALSLAAYREAWLQGEQEAVVGDRSTVFSAQ